METVETWWCQHVFILKALQGSSLFTHKSTGCHGCQHCDLVEATTFPEFLPVLQANCFVTLCSVQLLHCHPLCDTVTCPLLSDLFWLLWQFCWLIMHIWGEGRNNVLILHSYPHICIRMSWISGCWVLQLGILPFPTTFCFSSGFNLYGLENASRLWGLPKTNNN